jgi:DNA recombination-dependent growth factor C
MKYRKMYLFSQIHTVIILTKSWMIAQRSMRAETEETLALLRDRLGDFPFFFFTEAATLSGDEAAGATSR